MDNIAPMLAAQSKTVSPVLEQAVDQLAAQGYWFDMKWDGIRCIAYVEAGVVRLVNRRFVDITFRYPEVVAALTAAFPGKNIVLDGEIICWGDDGKPDFSRMHRRDAQQSVAKVTPLVSLYPATFMVFDLLAFNHQDLKRTPYVARRQLLQVIAQEFFGDHDELDFSVSDLDGKALWAQVVEHGLEGLIAKKATSVYAPGSRSSGWIKLKPIHTLSAVVTGYSAGKGKRAGEIGALCMTLIDGSTPVQFGEVGTGFKDADLPELKAKIDAGELLVIEVEVQNVTKDGKPRFPSYKGIRTDVLPIDCTTDQLTGIPVI